MAVSAPIMSGSDSERDEEVLDLSDVRHSYEACLDLGFNRHTMNAAIASGNAFSAKSLWRNKTRLQLQILDQGFGLHCDFQQSKSIHECGAFDPVWFLQSNVVTKYKAAAEIVNSRPPSSLRHYSTCNLKDMTCTPFINTPVSGSSVDAIYSQLLWNAFAPQKVNHATLYICICTYILTYLKGKDGCPLIFSPIRVVDWTLQGRGVSHKSFLWHTKWHANCKRRCSAFQMSQHLMV